MTAKFGSLWRQLNVRLDGHLSSLGGQRLDGECTQFTLSSGTRVVLRISPDARRSEVNGIRVSNWIGLNYPQVELLYRQLWAINVTANGSDIYCPIVTSLSNVACTIPRRGFYLPVDAGDDQQYVLLHDAVATALSFIELNLGRIEDVVRVLEGSPESPWFSLMAKENFLPVLLVSLGRKDEALALAEQVSGEYGPDLPNQARATAYCEFLARLRAILEV